MPKFNGAVRWVITIIGIISCLVFLGYVQGYYVPEYPRLELPDRVNYIIDPETILTTLDERRTDVFTHAPLETVGYSPPIWPSGSFSWRQTDYMKIANALHQFVWKESLKDWQLINAYYRTDECRNVANGFDYASFDFFQRKNDSYVVHTFWLSYLYADVTVGERYYHYTGQWQGVDLNKVIVNSADAVLIVAEDNGGEKNRLTVNNKCRITVSFAPYTKYDLISHPFNLYDWGWKVHYFNDGLPDDFEITIDPYTGK